MKKNLYKENIPLPDWLFPYLGEINYRPKVYCQATCPKCTKGGWVAKLILELNGLWEVWQLCPDCLFVLKKRTFTTRGQADASF